MFDIGETVRQGFARAAERGVSFVTVHGDGEIMQAAVEGAGNSPLKILAITVLTSLDADGLRDLGYLCSVEELIRLRGATIDRLRLRRDHRGTARQPQRDPSRWRVLKAC